MFSTRDVDHDRRSRRRERRQSACGVRARSGEKRGNGRGGAAEGRKGTHAQGRDHDVEDLAAVHAVLVREDLVQALGGVREGSGDVRAFRLGGVPGHGRDGADRVERRFLGGRVRSVRDRRRARGRLRRRRAREVDRRVVLRERGHQRRRRRLRLTRRAGHDRAASSGVTKRESRWCVGNDARRRSQTETADFWFGPTQFCASIRCFFPRRRRLSRETLDLFLSATQTGAPRSARSHTRARATTARVRPAVRAEPRDPSRLPRASPGRSRGHGARVAGRAGRPRRRRARRLPNQSAVPAGKRRGQRRGGHARARRGDDAGPGDGREA